jgi:regulator of RNase E activity RraA
MTHTKDIERPDSKLVERIAAFGAANLASMLYKMGIRDVTIKGPVSHNPGMRMAGPALTLQFMPKREDIYGEDEYADPEKQLHRHVLYHTQKGDIVVVDARGDMRSGVFGEMMMTFLKGRGGAGVVIDGVVRDYPTAKHLGLGMWVRGFTPNFHTQNDIMPFAVNVPIACGGALVMPGDIIVADDDGAVVVPVALAPEIAEKAKTEYGWEEFAKEKLLEGGDLRVYYPLTPAAVPEYEAWKQRKSV